MRRLLASLAACLTVTVAAQVHAQVAPEPVPDRRVAAASTAEPLTANDVDAWLDGFMPYALARGDIAGAVVVVVKDGAILSQRGYGYADVERGLPVDPERTLFRPGSLAKLFTWTAVMQLVEAGRLDLDADINTYLDFTIPPREGEPITLRHIMTHTPGFDDSVRDLITNNENVGSLEAVLKRHIPARVARPGVMPAYSNYGTGLAGYIVQRVSGLPFETYVERRIFTPLGMSLSTFRQPLPASLEPLMSRGYRLASGEPRPFEIVSMSPAGGLSAPGADMGRFMIAYLEGGALGDGRILKPETVRQMWAPPPSPAPVHQMLLGFYEDHTNGRRVVAHAGDTSLFHSEMHLFVDEGVGLYVSMNSAGAGDAISVIRTQLFRQFADRYFPGPKPQGSVGPQIARAHAALVAGPYETSRRNRSTFMAVLGLLGPIVITDNGDGTITAPLFTGVGGEAKTWREIAPYVWRESRGDRRLIADVEDGRIVRVRFDDLPYMVFTPMPSWRSPAWLGPALRFALLAFALTALLWPAAVLARRRYGAAFRLSGQDAWAYRLIRVFGLLIVLSFAGWLWAIATMGSDSDLLSAKMDGALWTLQGLTALAAFGGLAVSLWNAWRIWRGSGRGWFARTWSLVLVVSAAIVVWVAVVFKLVAFSVLF